MMKKKFGLVGLTVFLVAVSFLSASAQEKIPDFKLVKLSSRPVLDGDDSDWKQYPTFKVDIEGEVTA
ncbi:MAG: hypothetical protein ACE5GM_04475, partial [bacterium]